MRSNRLVRTCLRSSLSGVIFVLVGCAAPDLPPPIFSGSLSDALGAERAAPAIEDPFRLDADARAWLRECVSASAPATERFDTLVGLFGEDGPLAMRYELTQSTGALETLAAGEGNCLSFTILFVALARELGLEARVQEVVIPASRSRLADVTVANRHVVAWGRIDDRPWEVDFGVFRRPVGTAQRLLDDREVAATLASNMGATKLALGGDGTAELRSAVGSVPELAQGWTNLGVALRRAGEDAGAEFAFRRALAAEPGDGSALSGLLALYRASAPQAALELEARMPRLLARNPYFLYSEGLALDRAGEFAAAERHFRRALRMQPDEPWFHIALVRNRLAEGDVDDAIGALERARRVFEDEAQYALLISELLSAPEKGSGASPKAGGAPPAKVPAPQAPPDPGVL